METGAYPFEATVIAEEVKDPEAVYRSLLPESGKSKRFESSVRLENDKVVIEIKAKDPTALRAAINSYLRLLSLLDDLEERL